MKGKFADLVSLLLSPLLMCVAGVILLISPDTASKAIAVVLGWGLLALGVGFVLRAISSAPGRASAVISALVCLGLGMLLLRSPLLLAVGVGRVLGLLLIVWNFSDLKSPVPSAKYAAIATLVAGIVLLLLPMTTSRIVFSLCGLVLLVMGIANIVRRLRNPRLPGDDDPNIIDAL